MRNLYLLVCVLATGLLFTSCKKEDKKSTPESSIMGKWKGDKTINTINMNGFMQTDTNYWKAPDYLSIEFKNNNILVYNEFRENELDTDELYYKVVGNKLSLMEDANDPEQQEFTFKVNGNKLILSGLESGEEGGVTWKINSEMHFTK